MISAIVLAAGLSRRMGSQNKLLLPLQGKPLVAHVYDQLSATQVGEILVVLGHEPHRVQDALAGREIHFVHNEAYATGMTSSIQAGVKQISPKSRGMMICLSDMPFISPPEYQEIIDAFLLWREQQEQLILIPTYQQRRGNPVIFSDLYKDRLLQHADPNGCQGVVKAHKQYIKEWEMNTHHIFQDIDTPEDFQGIQA